MAGSDDGSTRDDDLDALRTDLSESSRTGNLNCWSFSSDTLVTSYLELSGALGDTLSVSELEPSLRTAELSLGSRHGSSVLGSELDLPGDGLPLVLFVAFVNNGWLGGMRLGWSIESRMGKHLLGRLLSGFLGGPDSL